MKKLFLCLIIAILVIFVLYGCQGLVPSEGEGEVDGVTVEIDGAVELGGKTYVSAGNHDITITFSAPKQNVSAFITGYSGYYGKGDVVLFPNTDKITWTGSGIFGGDDCCASYVEIISGECEPEICITFPVIIDAEPPHVNIEVCIEPCICE